MNSIFHIIGRSRFLQYVIIIEFIDLWSEFGAISCEAVIRASRAWAQEVTSALSVITVVWPGTRQTPRADKIKGWGGGGWIPTCPLWRIGRKNYPTLTSDSVVVSAASESVNWRMCCGEQKSSMVSQAAEITSQPFTAVLDEHTNFEPFLSCFRLFTDSKIIC